MKSSASDSHQIDGRLRFELLGIARRIRTRKLHLRAARIWLGGIGAGILILGLGWLVPAITPYASILHALNLVVVGMLVIRAWSLEPVDYKAAGELVEASHTDLDAVLLTALEQEPQDNGRYNFLQRRVLGRALDHALANNWSKRVRPGRSWTGAVHALAVAAILALFLPTAWLPHVADTIRPSFGGDFAVEITPGNVEVERGSTVVIAARFDDRVPSASYLFWTDADGRERREPMARSLSDPVYAVTLPTVSADVDYRVEHDGGTSETFRLSVYDLPALVQANADLDYPEYTQIEDKRIEDTRRISAVEGTQLDYEFLFNKPVQRAVLREADGAEIELEASNPERTRFATSFSITESKRFGLHLEDDAGRANPVPSDIRVAALPNQRPDLKINFPRGDQRVSALEEVDLQSEAGDDFGLLDYGLAFVIGAEDPQYVSLKNADEATKRASFEYLLSLEPRDVEPFDLVTWFAWAEDHGPDSAVRQTTSDLFFAEVRPFDESFREGQQGQQNQGGQGGGGPAADLLETQRQISIAIWKLRREDPVDPLFLENLGIIREAQAANQAALAEISPMIEDERLQAAARAAGEFMEQALDGLDETLDQKMIDPLTPAWTASQGAYQALLALQPRDYNVTRGSGGGGGGRNQGQLNQLRFNSEENRYETASEAQGMTSPEEREQLEILSRLRELARRQQDVNDRLQELQTALEAAQDESERERLRRELKRLEEEQRRMLADLDEVRQRLDEQPPNSQARETREQLERTREDMRESGEAIEQGAVSQALATGTRVQEDLQQASDELRQDSSSRFSEQLREARQAARELADRQTENETSLDNLGADALQSLDDSPQREAIAQSLDQQRADLEQLLESLRQVTEDSEVAEPGLHRQLYDLLREQDQGPAEERLQASSDLLRRGFVEQARDLQPDVSRQIDELRRGVESAAESVLGDETSTLRFAQNELDELSRLLENERPEVGQPGQGQPQPGDEQRAGGQSPSDGELTEQTGAGREPGQEPGLAPGEQPGEQQLAAGEQPGEGTGQGSQGEAPQEGQQPGSGSGQQPSDEQSTQTAQAGGSQSGEGQQPGPGGNQPTGQPQGQGSGGQQSGQQPGGGQGGNDQRLAGGGGGGGLERGGSGGGGGNELADLTEALEQLANEGNWENEGPLTGDGFTEWTDRLRTVESLLDLPGARERIAAAREQAEELRREYRRHGRVPQWGLVEDGIAAPLAEVRTWLRQELARRENPQSLHPVDRDPVPERFAEAVQKYYEALGE